MDTCKACIASIYWSCSMQCSSGMAGSGVQTPNQCSDEYSSFFFVGTAFSLVGRCQGSHDKGSRCFLPVISLISASTSQAPKTVNLFPVAS
jgi:hypothetical protein